MHDLGRHRRPVDGQPAACRRPCLLGRRRPRRPASASCRFPTVTSASTSRPIPNALGTLQGGDRQGRRHAGQAGLHDPHRRHHPSVEAEAVRRRRPGDRPERGSRFISCPASTTSSTKAGKAYLDRYGKDTKGAGWYTFDQAGVHFIGLVNVVDLKAGGMGNLGAEQLAWLADDLAGKAPRRRSSSSRIFRCGRSRRNGAGAPRTAPRRSRCLARFGSVTVLNGHIHQMMQKVEGNVAFHTARSTAFPQPAPGAAPRPARCWFPPASCASCSASGPSSSPGRQGTRGHRHALASEAPP